MAVSAADGGPPREVVIWRTVAGGIPPIGEIPKPHRSYGGTARRV